MDPEEHRYLEFFKKLSILGDNGHFTAGVVHRDYIAGVLQVLYVSCGICKHCPLLPKDGHEKQIQFT